MLEFEICHLRSRRAVFAAEGLLLAHDFPFQLRNRVEYSIIVCGAVAVIKSSKKKATRFFRGGRRQLAEKLQPLFQDRGGFEAYGTARLDTDGSASLWISAFTGFA
jgi:hypothetical protein